MNAPRHTLTIRGATGAVAWATPNIVQTHGTQGASVTLEVACSQVLARIMRDGAGRGLCVALRRSHTTQAASAATLEAVTA